MVEQLKCKGANTIPALNSCQRLSLADTPESGYLLIQDGSQTWLDRMLVASLHYTSLAKETSTPWLFNLGRPLPQTF